MAAIVGGLGTLWGPVLGALVLHLLADMTRNLFGQLPGINMVIYGVVLVLMVMFLPRGVAGLSPPKARDRPLSSIRVSLMACHPCGPKGCEPTAPARQHRAA